MLDIATATMNHIYIFYAQLAQAGWTEDEIRQLDTVLPWNMEIRNHVNTMLEQQREMLEVLRGRVLNGLP